mgnify:CR=1 FL=1
MPTSAARAKVATGTTIKTLLQLKSTIPFKILAWGISFDASAAATPVMCELVETGTVAATVTALADADIVKMEGVSDQVNASTAGMTLSTSGTGYTASAEGTVTSTRSFDDELVAPTNQYIYQFPLGYEPKVIAGNIARIRVTAPATTNAICWVEIDI